MGDAFKNGLMKPKGNKGGTEEVVAAVDMGKGRTEKQQMAMQWSMLKPETAWKSRIGAPADYKRQGRFFYSE